MQFANFSSTSFPRFPESVSIQCNLPGSCICIPSQPLSHDWFPSTVSDHNALLMQTTHALLTNNMLGFCTTHYALVMSSQNIAMLGKYDRYSNQIIYKSCCWYSTNSHCSQRHSQQRIGMYSSKKSTTCIHKDTPVCHAQIQICLKHIRNQIRMATKQPAHHRSWGSSAAVGFLPISFATTGVNATVGGNLTGDNALCAAYAMATVPTLSLVSEGFRPKRWSNADTSTPAKHTHNIETTSKSDYPSESTANKSRRSQHPDQYNGSLKRLQA